jgi:hypothetical protein
MPPGQRVQRGDRLVEQQQPGLFGQGQRQRQLGSLPAAGVVRSADGRDRRTERGIRQN